MADYKQLITIAQDMRDKSYSPYSHFAVGAALLAKSGKIYTGCNIENAGFTPTICAERVAFFKAVSEGEREFEAIALVGGRHGEVADFCAPCGVCRQVMSEWVDNDFILVLGNKDNYTLHTYEEIMPYRFDKSNL